MRNDTEMRGHTYDLDLLAAPMHHLLTYQRLDQVMGTEAMGPVMERLSAIRVTLELRAQNLHELVLVRPDGSPFAAAGW